MDKLVKLWKCLHWNLTKKRSRMKQTFTKQLCCSRPERLQECCTDLGREQKDTVVILDTLKVCVRYQHCLGKWLHLPALAAFPVPYHHFMLAHVFVWPWGKLEWKFCVDQNYILPKKKKRVSFSLDQLAEGKYI